MSNPNSRFTVNRPRLETNLEKLAQAGIEKEEENFYFKQFLDTRDGKEVDALVQTLNAEITPAVDCTACGNCCKSLMINVTQPEVESLAGFLQMEIGTLKEKYIETGLHGDLMVVNTMPCHFLKDKICSIYEHRFAECREFPGLHKGNFKKRMFATFMHYGRCPIVYNVVEQLKADTGFNISGEG